jgi:hypothetical protein
MRRTGTYIRKLAAQRLFRSRYIGALRVLRRGASFGACLVGVAVVASGCAGSNSSPSRVAPPAPAQPPGSTAGTPPGSTAGTSSTAPPAVPTATSYSAAGLGVSAGGFRYTFTFQIGLGASSTNTQNESPPGVNLVIPVSGNAELTDATSGYTAHPGQVPILGVWALYPSNSAACGFGVPDTKSFSPGPQTVCALDIAEFGANCGTDLASLGDGQSVSLVPWAQWEGRALNVLSAERFCSVQSHVPSAITIKNVKSASYSHALGGAMLHPKDWVVVVENYRDSRCRGQFGTGRVVASRSGSITGCIDVSPV